MLTRERVKAIGLAIVGVALGFALSLAVGTGFTSNTVSDFDADLFASVVPKLQQNQSFTDATETLTQMGAVAVNFGMAFAVGLFGAAVHRKLIFALLVPLTLAGAHAFQNLTIEIVNRDIPTEHVIGHSGGYFSGGVMRVILITAMLATLALPKLQARYVYALALGLGILEGFTRLVLGRHWPLDIVAAMPIGLGIAWAFRSVALTWFSTPTDVLELDY